MAVLHHVVVMSAFLACVCSKDILHSSEASHYSVPVPTEALRCGGIVYEEQGSISYKLNEALVSNERCVWTVRAPSANSYEVSIDVIQNLPGALIINGLGLLNLTTYFVPSVSDTTVTIPDSNVLVVTFYTGLINSTDNLKGFELHYKGISSGMGFRATGWSVQDVIASEDLQMIRHPPTNCYFDNWDLSVFIFPPLNNTWQAASQIEVTFHEIGLHPTAYDHILVYGFDTSSSQPHKWNYLGMIRGGNTTVTKRNDIIMMVFESNNVNVDKGFYFTSFQSKCASV